MTDVLTNPAWHTLIGAHASHTDSRGIARRYDPDVSVFHAIDAFTAEAWEDVAHLATNGVVVFLREAPLPHLQTDGGRPSRARATRWCGAPARPRCRRCRPPTRTRAARVTSRALTHDDVDAMVDLVTRTQPGPFRPGTIELGGYIGIFHEDALVAMAGRRFRPPGYCEVSAVCTDPTARRRGYASILTARVADDIAAEGDTPMLHVADDNDSARAAYEQLGFEVSRKCGFAAMQVPRSPQ